MGAARRAWQWLARWWKSRPGPADQVAVARNAARIAALADEVAEVKAELAEQKAQRAQMDSLAEGFAQAFGAAGKPLPDCVAADSPTQPIYLRAV